MTFFMNFLVLGKQGASKVCQVGTHWMLNLILHPTSSPDRNLSKNAGRYVENTKKKVVFFFSSSKINKYSFIILTIILLFSLGGPFGVKISSNEVLIYGHGSDLKSVCARNCFQATKKQANTISNIQSNTIRVLGF